MALSPFGSPFPQTVIEGMVEGEFLQDELIQRGSYTESELAQVALLKTGLLFQWCLKSPFLVAPTAHQTLVNRFENFGRQLGITFQKKDDLDDIDQPGEINAVFLEAAKAEGCSPLAKCFRADSIRHGQSVIKQQLRLEVNDLRIQLEEIGRRAAGLGPQNTFFRAPEKLTLQKECLRALVQITESLRPQD